MTELFSETWMQALKNQWNGDPEIRANLAQTNFSAIIAYGFKNERNPRSVFVVEGGLCVRTGHYNEELADWDMRALHEDWLKWLDKGVGVTGLTLAYCTGKLVIHNKGQSLLISQPQQILPLTYSLQLMSRMTHLASN